MFKIFTFEPPGGLCTQKLTAEGSYRTHKIFGYASVPDAPARIKALATNDSAILVSWMPPARPNGVIRGYTLYFNNQSSPEVTLFDWLTGFCMMQSRRTLYTLYSFDKGN